MKFVKSHIQFSHSVMSDSSRPYALQHTRPPCPSPTPRVYTNSCPLSQWCHPTISSFVILFSSCLQSFPASGFFPVIQFFASGGQSIGVSASASVLPMNIQDLFLLGLTGLISLQSKGLSRVFSNTTVQKHQRKHSAFFVVQLSHPYMTTGKTIALIIQTFVDKGSIEMYKIICLVYGHTNMKYNLRKNSVATRSDWAELKAFPLWPSLWGWAEVNSGSCDSSHPLI